MKQFRSKRALLDCKGTETYWIAILLEQPGLVVSGTQMVVLALKGHDFSGAANGPKRVGL
jgi:hypothetical protein